MRSLLLLFLFSSFLINAQIPKFDWIIAEGHQSEIGFYLVKTDVLGNTIATIEYLLSPFELCNNNYNLINENTAVSYLVKYDSKGQCIWNHQFTDNETGVIDLGLFISTDQDGNILVSGAHRGKVWLDSDHFIQSPDGVGEAFFAKLDPQGKLLWYKIVKLENGKIGDVAVDGLQSDQERNIYLTSSHSSSKLIFDDLPIDYSSNSGASKTTLFKLDSNGNLIWYKKFEAYGSVFQNFKINSKKQLILAGSFSGRELKIDERVLVNRNIISPDNSSDAVLTVLDSAGQIVFLQSIGGDGDDYFMTLEIDKEDNMYVGGSSFLSDEIKIYSSSIIRSKTNKEWNNYIAKITHDNKLDWIFDDLQIFGHFGIYNITLDKNQDLWVCCKLESDTFYYNNIPYFSPKNSSPDILYLRMNRKAELNQVFTIHGKGRDHGNWGDWSGGLHQDGGLVISGTYASDTLYFGDIPLPKVSRNQIGDRTSSAFIARISPDSLVGTIDPIDHENKLFHLNPNPAQYLLSISFDEPVSEMAIIELISATGIIVYKTVLTVGTLSHSINLRNYPEGVYFVRIRDQSGRSGVQKLVVE